MIVEQLSQLFAGYDRSVDWDHCPDRTFGRDMGPDMCPILPECLTVIRPIVAVLGCLDGVRRRV